MRTNNTSGREKAAVTDLNAMTAEEVIQHFGVKGMHWGVRNKPTAGRGVTLKPGRSTGEIRVARRNVRKAGRASLKEKGKLVVGKSSMKKMHQKKIDFLMHPDRETAARMTRGETALVALFSTPAGAAGVAGLSQFRSRIIKSRQTEGYQKPGKNRARIRVIGG